MGLVVHPISGFIENKVKEYRVFALIIIGYQGSPKDVDEHTLEKEKKPRQRKPLNEIVFWEGWEKLKDEG